MFMSDTFLRGSLQEISLFTVPDLFIILVNGRMEHSMVKVHYTRKMVLLNPGSGRTEH